MFACNICNEVEDDEHIYDKHEDLTLDIWNSDKHTDAEEENVLR